MTIRHGKGDKRRIVKLPVDVRRTIDAYLTATGRSHAGPAAPLFVAFYKKASDKGITALNAWLKSVSSQSGSSLHSTPAFPHSPC